MDTIAMTIEIKFSLIEMVDDRRKQRIESKFGKFVEGMVWIGNDADLYSSAIVEIKNDTTPIELIGLGRLLQACLH
jgi:hypothetical protein